MRGSERDRGTSVFIDFAAADEPPRWAPVDDAVMGGRSASRLVATGEGSCAFEGHVSLADGGGFASVRRRPGDLDLSGASALLLTFRGDGKRYKLRLRTSDARDGVSYLVAFPTEAGAWQTRRFRADELAPTWRGRPVPDAPALALADVRSVGLLISDGQAGPFRLEVASLAAE